MKRRLRPTFVFLFTVLAAASAAASIVVTTASAQTRPTIVWIEQGANNPYWDAQHKAAAEAGNRLGFDFRAVSGNNSVSDQANIMRQLVDQKVSLIMLNAIDLKAMGPALDYANSQGVPVVNLYGVAEQATASIGFDEQRSGRVAATYAVSLLQQRYGQPSGSIAILTGILGQAASDDRAQGFTDYMTQQQPSINVVDVQPTDWQADKASATMQDWLVKYPDLSMVYTLSDTLAVPAMNIAQGQNQLCTADQTWTSNPTCVTFVSVDGFFIKEVQQGRLAATEVYSPEWSGYAFGKLAYQVAMKQAYDKNTTLKSLLVTPENADCIAMM
ncbi:MAG: sugar ABC transporter substrate-binding protein, partial [Chloroflexota bacterium]|nr:sugar ABC transporter substrate-binding protein [Chloroflexota bacterium]